MWFRTSKQQPKATHGAAPPFMPEPQSRESTANVRPAQAREEEQESAPRGPGFFRRHPVLAIAGAAGVGLLGGVEMALGVALGAGVAALVRPKSSQRMAQPDEQGAWRDRAQELWDHAPDELRKRARAVIEAARGHTEAAPQA
jgi:hypothetical protein